MAKQIVSGVANISLGTEPITDIKVETPVGSLQVVEVYMGDYRIDTFVSATI